MRRKTSRQYLAFLLGGLVVLVGGCKSAPPPEPPYTPGEGAVGFDVVREATSANSKGSTNWLATFKSEGHTAHFMIELGGATASSTGRVRIGFGKGRFTAIQDSDNSVLMAELGRALEAKSLLQKSARVASLPFEYAALGDDLYRGPNGGLSGDRKGNWIALKVFLGDDEGEVFLNLNPVLHKGEFSVKDSDYGDFVVRELAKVL
jgi:hypothetical protein